MDDDPTLRARLERHLDELPVLPVVVAKLMALDRSDDDYADNVVALISAEPNFSIRVIAAANSAASAPQSPITTVGAAIARIGSINASNLIITLGVTRVFIPRDDWERGLWSHALRVGLMARALVSHARPEHLSPDEAYVAGLLHDVGRFVLFQEAPEQLRRVDESNWDTPEALLEYEKQICGLNHAELGALACKKWSIPDTIAGVIERHHNPPDAPTDPAGRLTAIVHIADLVMFPSAMACEDGYEDADIDTIARTLCPGLPPDVAMSAEDLHRIIVTVTEEADSTLKLIGLG